MGPATVEQAARVIDLYVEGLDKPIGTTPNHPFWSETRKKFIRADELQSGEALLQADDGITTVIRWTPRTASEPVYNLEIGVEHVYHVGHSGLLVHNGTPAWCSSDPLVGDLANQIEAKYPGHVVGVNVTVNGQEVDILLQNAALQVKSGRGKGLTSQLARTEAATGLPSIGYGPNLGGSLVQGIEQNGGLVTRDLDLLLNVVAP